ncbi:MAG: hypothetical protein JWR10_4472 [Rubritepida sp.]|nr:hypothetical protein [Rubritepida sp.]
MNGPDEEFRLALESGELRLQHCDGCARAVFPPRIFCPHCGGTALAWRPAQGGGEVYSSTTVHMVPKGQAPYNVSLVALDEGVRLMGRVEGRQVVIGQRVTLRVEKAALIFSPEGETP